MHNSNQGPSAVNRTDERDYGTTIAVRCSPGYAGSVTTTCNSEGAKWTPMPVCTRCEAGTWHNTTSDTCDTCATGTISGVAARECTSCAQGKESNADSTNCERCQPGTVSDQEGQQCHECTDRQVPAEDQTRCEGCDPGKYAAFTSGVGAHAGHNATGPVTEITPRSLLGPLCCAPQIRPPCN